MNRFSYLVDKIRDAEFAPHPFKHIYIENFFSDEHFREIVESPEVALAPAESDEALIQALYDNSYKEIVFPGTTTDVAAYLKWHKHRTAFGRLCEGHGITMRLQKTAPESALSRIHAFFKSEPLWTVMANKFGIRLADVRQDFGLQKYLDGYEISPHPDIRAKALTFMVNINPAQNAEDLEYNTHYMVFKPERDYVRTFWSDNEKTERCWVPWDWCETKAVQTRNNTIVIFQPSNDTIHAVKANYDHLVTQRTQFYGNLWHKNPVTLTPNDFTALDLMKKELALQD